MSTKLRPPVVAVLGHVDHGKTTLLDTIRKSNIASREAGGITQTIGASKIETPKGNFTFIDTPGHALFSNMRSRGAKIADIALLMVAADDGVMPQTKEAYEFINENNLPFIVVFSKTDLAHANIEKAKASVANMGVSLEGLGGDTPYVEISAKNNKNIEELLELINLVSEVNEISADTEGSLEAAVVETNKDKRGNVASVIVRNGILKVGDEITDGVHVGKVKGMFDQNNKSVRQALPSDPVVVLGFNELPEVGAVIKNTKETQVRAEEKSSKTPIKVGEEQLPILVKAATAGSLEALVASLPKAAVVVRSGVGDVSDNDIFFAKSTGAQIITFDLKTPSSAKRLADTEDIVIKEFNIIYELIKYLEEELDKLQTKVLGAAEILQSFPFDKRRVAGCKILKGEFDKKSKLLLLREGEEIGYSKIVTIRKGKDEVEKVAAGEECGILFNPPFDFQPGDMLLSVK